MVSEISNQNLQSRNWRDFVVIDLQVIKEKKDEKPLLDENETEIKDKIKSIFLKIDRSEDGYMDIEEFRMFIKNDLEINMDEVEFNQLCEDIDTDKSKKIDFEEFYDYYIRLVRKNQDGDETHENIRNSLSSNSHLKSVDDQTQEAKRKAKLQNVTKELQYKAKSTKNNNLFQLLNNNKNFKEANSVDAVNDKLLHLFEDQDIEQLSDLIADRWESFTNFKRQGSTGSNVMTSSADCCDALPGEYDLVELVMNQYGEVPQFKIPKHAVIKPAIWKSSSSGNGSLICPCNWNGHIPIDFGTNQLLSYYGACLAREQEVKVGLLQRHGTVDFTYSKDYHENYVMSTAGGDGIETHAFHHMDCPLDTNSGFFVLGKWKEPEELHLTAFYIPKDHVVYVPPNTIHSNDHLKGRWRTMLSDSSNAPIDHVLFKKLNNEQLEALDIKFDASLVHFHNDATRVACKHC